MRKMITFRMCNLSFVILEIPVYVAGIAISAGFSAALADGKSIGMMTPTKYVGFALLPIAPIVVRLTLKLAMYNSKNAMNRVMQSIWNLLSSLSFMTFYIMLLLKLGLESSVPSKITYIQASIPLFISCGLVFIGTSMSIVAGSVSNRRRDEDVETLYVEDQYEYRDE